MKKIIYIIAVVIMNNVGAFSQIRYIDVCRDCNNIQHIFDFNFTDDSVFYYFKIDTTQSNNVWQLGRPNKTNFFGGYLGQNALVTDTVNPYPINNISSFQFSIINCSPSTNGGCGGQYWYFHLGIAYKIDSDSLLDGGTIETSHNGSPWKNLIMDSLVSYMFGVPPYSINDTIKSINKPGFSGISNDWKALDILYQSSSSASFDTIRFKFTFGSDSIQTNKDGWLIGLVQTLGTFEGIEEINNDNTISLYPNPASSTLTINTATPTQIKIINILGETVLTTKLSKENTIVDVSTLNKGIYFIEGIEGDKRMSAKFIKE